MPRVNRKENKERKKENMREEEKSWYHIRFFLFKVRGLADEQTVFLYFEMDRFLWRFLAV